MKKVFATFIFVVLFFCVAPSQHILAYTADLTMSMPVYKNHNRAWTLKTYDNFGTHASTMVDGNKLKLYNFGSTSTPSYVSGYWLSDPWDLSAVTNVEGSFIK